MAQRWLAAAIGIAALTTSACTGSSGPVAGDGSAVELRPTATIKDIMLGVIDPSADAIWESVQTVVDAQGTHEHYPTTEEEWEDLRGDAIRVLEASNLLMVPGRVVAEPGAKSEYPEVELEPAAIQALIDDDRDTFVDLAHGLHDAASEVFSAIDARDKNALLAVGDRLDRACERCHLQYWYPNDSVARSLFEQNERLDAELEGRGGSQ